LFIIPSRFIPIVIGRALGLFVRAAKITQKPFRAKSLSYWLNPFYADDECSNSVALT
jgi:hypothetical protein